MIASFLQHQHCYTMCRRWYAVVQNHTAWSSWSLEKVNCTKRGKEKSDVSIYDACMPAILANTLGPSLENMSANCCSIASLLSTRERKRHIPWEDNLAWTVCMRVLKKRCPYASACLINARGLKQANDGKWIYSFHLRCAIAQLQFQNHERYERWLRLNQFLETFQ